MATPSRHMSDLYLASRFERQTSPLLEELAVERAALVAKYTHNGVITCGPTGAVTWANHAYLERTRRQLPQLIGRPITEVLTGPSPSQRELVRLNRAIAERRGARVELMQLDVLGTHYWLEVDLQPVHCERGTLSGFVVVATDVTERVVAAKVAAAVTQRLERITANLPGAVVELRIDASFNFTLPFASAGLVNVIGVDAMDAQRDPSIVSDAIHPDDRAGACEALRVSARESTSLQHACRVRKPATGEDVWVELRAMPQRDVNGDVVWYGYVTDVTEKHTADTRLNYLANHDPLTGLRNRANITALIDEAIVTARGGDGHGVSVLLLDLNDFKRINDTLGHDVGDQLLVELARRLQANLRRADKIGRIGGDELVVLAADGVDGRAIDAIKRKVHACVEKPFVIGSHELRVSCSIGAAHMPQDGVTTAALLKRADAAMYAAKALRKQMRCATEESEA